MNFNIVSDFGFRASDFTRKLFLRPGVVVFLGLSITLCIAWSASAQQVIEKYQTAVGFPEIDVPGDVRIIGPGNTLGEFISYLFDMSLLVAAITAFGTLVFGGIMYMTSGLADTKSKAREIIQGAFIGILLLVGTYVILLLINPALTRAKLPVFPKPVPPSEKSATEKKGTNEDCAKPEDCISNSCVPRPVAVLGNWCAASPAGGRCSTRRAGDCATGLECNPNNNICGVPQPPQ